MHKLANKHTHTHTKTKSRKWHGQFHFYISQLGNCVPQILDQIPLYSPRKKIYFYFSNCFFSLKFILQMYILQNLEKKKIKRRKLTQIIFWKIFPHDNSAVKIFFNFFLFSKRIFSFCAIERKVKCDWNCFILNGDQIIS